MRASEVRPKDWLWHENYPIRILFESEEENYSIIWGKYQNTRALGVRWNGGTERGYPGQGGHPTWYVEPDFISIVILQRLQILAIESGDLQFWDNIEFAISELKDKMNDLNS